MNTSFGKLLETDGFKKVFTTSIILGAAAGGVMNGHAINTLFTSAGLAALVTFMYLALGVAALMQNVIVEKWRSRCLETLIGFSSCFLIYNVVLLLLWQLISEAASMQARVQAIGVFCLDILAALIVTAGYLHTKKIRCVPYTINLGLKGDPYRIVLLSDIHLGVFVGEEHIRKMVDQVNRLNADLVVICGDIVDVNNHILEEDSALTKISAILKTLYAKEGVFAVLGNHDPNIEHQKFKDFLMASNIQLLHNQVIHLSRLNLIGRTDSSNNHRCSLEALLDKIDWSKPAVVLDHNPDGIPEAVKWRMDLVLCGHTHKGQFFPVTYFTKLANGRRYFYGHEIFGRTHAVISAGAGFFQLPVRIGTSNEIVDIQLL